MGDWIAERLVRYHLGLLALALAIAAASWPLSRQLQLDWKVEGMFPPGHPLVDSYHKLQDRFGGNQVVLAVYRDPELWDESGAGLDRLADVSRKLAEVEGVDAVLSLSELHSILTALRHPMQLLNLGLENLRPAQRPPLLDPDDDLAQAFAAVFAGYTHQPGSHFVAVACLLDPPQPTLGARGGAQHEQTIIALRRIMQELPRPATEGLVTGEPVLVAEGFHMVQRDGWRLGMTSSILLLIVLLVCFRSIRWTLIPIVVVHWSLLVTRAILVAMKLDLTMISSTLTAIVTVIGVATAMHLLLRFQAGRRRGQSRHTALTETFSALSVAVAWACATDAVGFAALMFASVGPVRDFGLMMSIGSLMVLVAIALLVPGMALFGSWDTDPRMPKLDLWLRWRLRGLLDRVAARRRGLLGLLLVLTLYGLLGSSRMRVETDFTKNFKPGSPIVHGYDVIERELGGAGVWDIMLPAPPRIGREYFAQVIQLEDNLRGLRFEQGEQSVSLTKVLSIADADQASLAGPVLSALPVSARLAGMRRAMPEFTGALLSDELDATGHGWLRIMLRSRERAGAELKEDLVRAVSQELEQFTASPRWKDLFESEPPPAEVAGYHVMLGSLVSSILADQWKCFLLATLGIFTAMTLATRSLWLATVALIPNALPVLLVLGTMGWSGARVNMGAAMIAAVSLGLSVDSSIHYLLHYRRRLRAGDSSWKALRSAQENVGLAVVLATIALVAGFVSLCTSEFVPTVVFGTLASLTMIGGLLGNLVLLPLLLMQRGETKRTKICSGDGSTSCRN